MKLFCKYLIAALSFISINATASNANKFDYVGVTFQNSSYDNLNFAPGIDTSELTPLIYNDSSSATGYRGFLGHQFNRYIAVEAGISSFGKASFSVVQKKTASNGKTTNTTIHSGDFTTLAGDLRLIGTYPITDSLFLKAHIGALVWDNELSVLTQNTDELLVNKTSDTGISLLTGVGIGYGFNKRMAMSLDIEKTEIAKVTTQNLGVSFFVRF